MQARAHRLEARLLRDPVHFLALGFGAGLSPKAPGTFGTALALVPAWLMFGLPLAVRVAVIVVAFVAGIWICGRSAERLGAHDHPGIVWDEIVAMLAVALAVPPSAVWLAPAFVAFRLFDIAKPWPIRDVDHRLGGGLGIMLDDLMAAVYAAACLMVIRYFV
jgi:phosphatidylglycerophosphatase A